jgi:hypothetical protein
MLYSPHPPVPVIPSQSGIHSAVAVPVDSAVINRPADAATNFGDWVPTLGLRS